MTAARQGVEAVVAQQAEHCAALDRAVAEAQQEHFAKEHAELRAAHTQAAALVAAAAHAAGPISDGVYEL